MNRKCLFHYRNDSSVKPLSPAAVIAAFVAAALCGGSVFADELTIKGIAPTKVTFTGMEGDKLIYQSSSGSRNDREISRVAAIAVDGEPALNEAEKQYNSDDKAKSVDNYIKAIRATSKPWLRVFAARRLIDVTGNTDRFDAKLAAFLALLGSNPDEAQQYKPKLPAKGSALLDTAVTDIDSTLKQPNLPAPQQLALYNFLIEIHRQREDQNAVTATLEQLERLSDKLGNQPGVKEQLAALRVNQARQALDAKKYKEATKLVDDNRASIVDPRLQNEALFILAESQLAMADKANAKDLKESALAYLRVVAFSGDVEGRPHVLASLQKVATLLEQAGDKEGAMAILGQISSEFPNDPAAKQAASDLERLQAAS